MSESKILSASELEYEKNIIETDKLMISQFRGGIFTEEEYQEQMKAIQKQEKELGL